MFLKDETGVYRCDALTGIDWLEHGFGTRHSPDWPADGPRASLRQIHSNLCLTADGVNGCAGEGDALVATRPGQWASVRTADCVPILMVASRARVVAAVHAGWRGTAQDIAGKVVGALAVRHGVSGDELLVAIGPAIRRCCYEVGPEVLEQFRSLVPGLPRSGHGKLDLEEANLRLLVKAGVPEERISTGAPCTSCSREDFFSYRRAPEEKGRMISAIRIR